MVFGKVNYLNPMDIRQYLYCLVPKPEVIKQNKVMKGVTDIGKIDIVWKTNLGERGRLQTSQLQRVVSSMCFNVLRNTPIALRVLQVLLGKNHFKVHCPL